MLASSKFKNNQMVCNGRSYMPRLSSSCLIEVGCESLKPPIAVSCRGGRTLTHRGPCRGVVWSLEGQWGFIPSTWHPPQLHKPYHVPCLRLIFSLPQLPAIQILSKTYGILDQFEHEKNLGQLTTYHISILYKVATSRLMQSTCRRQSSS